MSGVTTTVSRTDARIPVGPEAYTAVTIVSPAEPNGTVLFAFPGGGYKRTYFDMTIGDGDGDDYSQAQWHAQRGTTVVCCDHLGVGDSSLLDPDTLSFEVLAAANHATVTGVLERIKLPGPVIGMGQSMGGCLVIHQQAHHRTFDGLAILGFSAVHTVLPTPSGGFDMPEGLSIEDSAALLTRTLLGHAFHYPDEPRSIVDEDVAGYPFRPDGRVPAWASASVPPAAVLMLTPGIVSSEAAHIDVPLLLVAGEVDVIPDFDHEATAYPAAPAITTKRLARAAHMHNFASSRELLWQDVQDWARSVSPRIIEVQEV